MRYGKTRAMREHARDVAKAGGVVHIVGAHRTEVMRPDGTGGIDHGILPAFQRTDAAETTRVLNDVLDAAIARDETVAATREWLDIVISRLSPG